MNTKRNSDNMYFDHPVVFDEELGECGEWISTSPITKREYFGETREQAETARIEDEHVWLKHHDTVDAGFAHKDYTIQIANIDGYERSEGYR